MDNNKEKILVVDDETSIRRILETRLSIIGYEVISGDVFPDPADGGQAPYRIYRRALDTGEFRDAWKVGSLRVLQRIGTPPTS